MTRLPQLIALQIVAFLSFEISAVAVEAPSLTVTMSQDVSDSFDGQTSLREAIAHATAEGASEVVTFAPGLTTVNLNTEIAIAADVTISGPGANQLTIRYPGGIAGGGRLFRVSADTERTVVIENVTLADGNYDNRQTTSDFRFNSGSAIYNDGGNIVARGVRFQNNTSPYAAAIHQLSGNLTLVKCVFSNNAGGQAVPGRSVGATIFNAFGTILLTGCTFTGNSSGDDSGTLRSSGGAVTLRDCVFNGNSAGGLNVIKTTLRAQRSTFANNTRTALSIGGDAIIEDCIISGNSATSGAGVRISGSGVIVRRCAIAANNANTTGGGVFFSGTSATLENNTLSGNMGTHGGGVYQESGALALVNNTIAGNAALVGRGVYVSGGTLNYRNNIIALNTLPGENDGGDDLLILNEFAVGNDQGYNLIGVDPKLGPLADNGGPTPTRALLAGSPAINGVGNNGNGAPVRDERGYFRADAPDIGSFEFSGVAPVLYATALTQMGSGAVILQARATPNQVYRILASPDLNVENFVEIGTATADATGFLQYTDATGLTRRFYQLVLP